MRRVPKGAQRKELATMTNIKRGVQFTWQDRLGKHILRVHDVDPSAPRGSNATAGPVYRVQHWRLYEDAEGNLHDPAKHVNRETGEYDEDFANATHIPWPAEIPLPYE
ncbi:polymorphic toxin type 30 domain-containing protein [Propionibacteriaceae bacterium Y1685]